MDAPPKPGSSGESRGQKKRRHEKKYALSAKQGKAASAEVMAKDETLKDILKDIP